MKRGERPSKSRTGPAREVQCVARSRRYGDMGEYYRDETASESILHARPGNGRGGGCCPEFI
jgi:hypothetical protein